MTTKKLFALLAALAILATACGGAEDSAAAADTPVEATGAETTTTEAETATTEAAVEEEPAEESTVDATPIDGQALYESNCARCHGSDGIGTRGPDLIDINFNVPDQQVAIDQVVNGGGGMPSFGERFSEDEVQAVIDYVYASF